MITLTSCHVKLIHWLPDSDTVELTNEFQLVDNFTVQETSSQLSIRSVIPKHFCRSHNIILHSSLGRTLKFTFNQTLISRFPHSVSSPWTKHSINRKKASLQRPVRQVLPTDQRPKLRAGCMLFDNYYTTIPEACIPSSDWFEYQQSINLLIISISVVDVDASLGW